MSYQAQAALEADYDYQQRTRAVAVQQADYFRNAAAGDQAALADGVLRGDPGYVDAIGRLNAAGPGIADKVDNGDGTIDSGRLSDDDLLSLTQANWPVVAGLYFAADGTPL